MKVTLKGKMKVRGNVKLNSKRLSKTLALRTIRKAVRSELIKERSRLYRKLDDLRAGIRRDARKELYSDRFANMIRDAVKGRHDFGDIADDYLNENVVLNTTGGTVAGKLIRVGDDVLVIEENLSAVLIVPFSSAVSIRHQ